MTRSYEAAIQNNKQFVIWGYGNYLNEVFCRLSPDLNIIGICDSDSRKWGKDKFKLGYVCMNPNLIMDRTDIVVLIAVQSKVIENEIVQILDSANIEHYHINDAVRSFQNQWEQEEIKKYDARMANVPEPGESDKLKRFISISVPVEVCNLRCRYCYIGQRNAFMPKEVIYHSPQFIRRALSRKRMGGTSLINFCGTGETLLCDELISIVKELLAEGHYISIITNAILTEQIKSLINVSKEYNERLFFKCSFHYAELLKKGLLTRFVSNIDLIKESGVSYSIELVPEDDIIPMIDEIKDFSMNNFGALPHLTVARDETTSAWPILTNLTTKEYYNIWGQFHSQMFSFKMNNREKQHGFCWAGDRALLFSLDRGDLMPCPGNKPIGNIYKSIDQNVQFEPVGTNCANAHCINAHAYLTLGLISEVGENSYLEMRDRETTTGEHWVQPRMASFMKQRLCDNYGLEEE